MVDAPLQPGPSGLAVWVGLVVMSVFAIAVVRLDEGVTRMVVGAALAICLVVVAAMVWVDQREARTTERLRRRR